MALVDIDGDPWLREHEACEKLFREIAAQLSERDQEIPRSTAYARLSASIRVRLGQLSQEVQQLKEKLSQISRSRNVTRDEAERRLRLVERLESSERQLQQRFNSRNIEDAASRSQLIGGRSQTSQVFADMGTTGWGDDDVGTPDVEAIQQTQQQAMRDQDESLEELSKIISRQKMISQSIGDELEVHCEILDDLADGIDRTTVGLINETQNVRIIDKKDTTWGYWLIIIILFITIVIVGIV